MAESFENLDNILRDWANDKEAEKSCRGIEQIREAERRKMKPFLSYFFLVSFLLVIFVLVSREPLLYLEFNKPNKQNVYLINLFKKSNFSQSHNNCRHTD